MILRRFVVVIVLAMLLAAPALGQGTDRIIYKNGQVFPAEGSGQKVDVTRETYSMIKYDLTSRNVKIPQEVSTHKIARVEYAAVPFDYSEALDNFKNGYFEEAVTAFRDIAEKKPRPWVEQYALYYAAECLYNLGKIDEAVEAYKELMTRVSDSKFIPDARLRLGECFLAKGDKVSAKAEFEGLKEYTNSKGYDPIYAFRADLGLVRILLADQTYAAALSRLEQIQSEAANEYPSVANEARLATGKVYILQQDFGKGEAFFKNVIEDSEGADPEILYGAYVGLGDCYFQQSQYKEALKDCFLRVVVANDRMQNAPHGTLVEALFKAARCFDLLREERGEYATYAQDLYREVIRTAPGSKLADDAQRLLRR